MALQAASSAMYIVAHFRCRVCGRGYFDAAAVLRPTCACGASTWQVCPWNLSISAFPALSAVAQVQI
jgi:hypothetical protein